METFDFGRSFLTFRIDFEVHKAITLSHQPPTTLNNARIQLECCCVLTELSSGKAEEYVLGASCKTEVVGAAADLWLLPNADFCPVASLEEFLIIKSWQKREMGVMRNPPSLGVQPERQSGLVKEAWSGFRIDLKRVEGRELATIEDIMAATFDNVPMVSRTEFEEGGYHVRIDHPVKTFNVSERENVYQTDTGPIILPDLSPERRAQTSRLVECFDLAYSAFNAPGWAEFIVNVPTPLAEGIAVNHYAQPRRIDNARNTLLALP